MLASQSCQGLAHTWADDLLLRIPLIASADCKALSTIGQDEATAIAARRVLGAAAQWVLQQSNRHVSLPLQIIANPGPTRSSDLPCKRSMFASVILDKLLAAGWTVIADSPIADEPTNSWRSGHKAGQVPGDTTHVLMGNEIFLVHGLRSQALGGVLPAVRLRMTYAVPSSDGIKTLDVRLTAAALKLRRFSIDEAHVQLTVGPAPAPGMSLVKAARRSGRSLEDLVAYCLPSLAMVRVDGVADAQTVEAAQAQAGAPATSAGRKRPATPITPALLPPPSQSQLAALRTAGYLADQPGASSSSSPSQTRLLRVRPAIGSLGRLLPHRLAGQDGGSDDGPEPGMVGFADGPHCLVPEGLLVRDLIPLPWEGRVRRAGIFRHVLAALCGDQAAEVPPGRTEGPRPADGHEALRAWLTAQLSSMSMTATVPLLDGQGKVVQVAMWGRPCILDPGAQHDGTDAGAGAGSSTRRDDIHDDDDSMSGLSDDEEEDAAPAKPQEDKPAPVAATSGRAKTAAPPAFSFTSGRLAVQQQAVDRPSSPEPSPRPDDDDDDASMASGGLSSDSDSLGSDSDEDEDRGRPAKRPALMRKALGAGASSAPAKPAPPSLITPAKSTLPGQPSTATVAIKIGSGSGWRTATAPTATKASQSSSFSGGKVGFKPIMPSLLSSSTKPVVGFRPVVAVGGAQVGAGASSSGSKDVVIDKTRVVRWLEGPSAHWSDAGNGARLLPLSYPLRILLCPVARHFPSAALAPAAALLLGPGEDGDMPYGRSLSTIMPALDPSRGAGDGCVGIDHVPRAELAACMPVTTGPRPFTLRDDDERDEALEQAMSRAARMRDESGHGGGGACTNVDMSIYALVSKGGSAVVQPLQTGQGTEVAGPEPMPEAMLEAHGDGAMQDGQDGAGGTKVGSGAGASSGATAAVTKQSLPKAAKQAAAQASSAGPKAADKGPAKAASAASSPEDEAALAAVVASIGPVEEQLLTGKAVGLPHLKAYCRLIAKAPVGGNKAQLVERVLAHMAKGQ